MSAADTVADSRLAGLFREKKDDLSIGRPGKDISPIALRFLSQMSLLEDARSKVQVGRHKDLLQYMAKEREYINQGQTL